MGLVFRPCVCENHLVSFGDHKYRQCSPSSIDKCVCGGERDSEQYYFVYLVAFFYGLCAFVSVPFFGVLIKVYRSSKLHRT